MRNRWHAALVALGLATGAPWPVAAAEPKLPVPEIERIVRDYLLREPEVIYQAIQELQRRQKVEEAKRQQAAIADSRDEIFDHAEDPVVGGPDAKVTLVEFLDYRCGYCRIMSAGLRKLMDGDRDLRFVFKELPVLGPDSVVAAKAALAANRIDPTRYRDFHLALMQSKELSQPAVLQLAAQKGYDADALAKEMDAGWVAARIDANHDLANRLGISGTPSFVIGDTLIPGAVDIGELASRISEQRQQAN
jgi:protein-disulfide isomerase